ncbi:MAG: cytochrome c biogenesis protein CcsA [Phycisphaerae bacterium]
MELKLTLQGAMIYATMVLYVVAGLAMLLKFRRVGWVVAAAGFLCASTSWLYRWAHADHFPAQTMFEVFLTLGMVLPLLSALGRWGLKTPASWADMLLGAAILFPAGFVARFAEAPQKLPPALQSGLFVPHVMAYMAAYVAMAKAAILAVGEILGRPVLPGLVDYDRATYRMICLGFPLLTLGLVLGSWWAKLAIGDFWHWDPKELWSLVSWLVYVGYFHLRYRLGRRGRKFQAALAVLGLAAIVVTLLAVTLLPALRGWHSYAD